MRRLILLALPLCSACFTYAPVQLSALPSGAPVRAHIGSVEAERLEPLIGRESRVIDGVLVGTVADSVLLDVATAAQTVSGGGMRVLHQRVAVPLTAVTELELKRLSRTRTTLAVAGGSVALGYILVGALNIGPGSEGSRGGNGGTDFRIPLLILVH
jgi:hypothetical protein